jgi:2-polyprenyl-3-methyl-5-hydroxy-6-metoxy-1,4-benzoquinol methylase
MNTFFYNDVLFTETQLEAVSYCPICGSARKARVDDDVRDWYYRSSAQSWNYWECGDCKSLYLDPRPSADHIGKAYANYYTHGARAQNVRDMLKERIRHECYSHWLNIDITPRLHIPRLFGAAIDPLKAKLQIPFSLDLISRLPQGKILDVGCGSGKILAMAKQLGWEATGVEFDLEAVAKARTEGLVILEGDYRILQNDDRQYDLVICSHVIEHVDDPMLLLDLLADAVTDGGALALAFPNAQSLLRKHYKGHWRGYEAPRHLSIPSADKIESVLKQKFEHVVRIPQPFDMRGECEALLRLLDKSDGGSGNPPPDTTLSYDLAGFYCSAAPIPAIGA